MSIEISFIAARDVRPFDFTKVEQFEALTKLGIGMDSRTVDRMMDAMDALTPTVTTGSIATPVQFLQSWLPGFVNVVTAARKIDELVGIQTIGSWEDEEIVQGSMEVTGTSTPYGDYTNTPFSSWNANFERRTIVRFEEGMRVGALDEARAAKMRVNSAESKREGAALALEIQRNRVGLNGYNNGVNRTYGFLNDPALPAYADVAAGASTSKAWSTKTFLEITADIREAAGALENQSGGLIDTSSEALTLAIPTSHSTYLTVTSDFGVSVMDWIKKTFSNMRIVKAPELNGANGGASVFYLYAEKTKDNSTDGGNVFVQAVPSKFQVLGVQKLAKGYEEAYTNATAGVLCKRGWAVVRRSAI